MPLAYRDLRILVDRIPQVADLLFQCIDSSSRSQLGCIWTWYDFNLQFTYPVLGRAALTDLSIVGWPDAPSLAMSTFLAAPGSFSDAFCRTFLRHGESRNRRQNASEQKLRISAAAAAPFGRRTNQKPSTPHSFVSFLTCSPTTSHCTLTQL